MNTNTVNTNTVTETRKFQDAIYDRRKALVDAMLIVGDARWACDDEDEMVERVFRSLEKSWEDTL